MVVHGGVRYRVEDAKRLGLVADPSTDAEAQEKAVKPRNKARRPANKEQ